MGNTDKRARQRANREARRERERKEQRRRQTFAFARRAAIALAVVLVAGIIISTVFGGDDEPSPTTALAFDSDDTSPTTDPDAATTTSSQATTTTASTPTTADVDSEGLTPEYLAFRALPTACGATAPDPVTPMEFSTAEDQGLSADDTVVVTMETSCGTVVMELDPALAPESVNSFVFLARQGYFDGVVSHRIVPGFVVQAGDPTATGRGGPGYDVVDEFPDEGFAYDRGVVAMAKTPAPNTTGSQFFIAFASTGLSNEFNALGRVVEGLDVLDAIEAIPIDPADPQGQRPAEALYIEDVTVEVR